MNEWILMISTLNEYQWNAWSKYSCDWYDGDSSQLLWFIIINRDKEYLEWRVQLLSAILSFYHLYISKYNVWSGMDIFKHNRHSKCVIFRSNERPANQSIVILCKTFFSIQTYFSCFVVLCMEHILGESKCNM